MGLPRRTLRVSPGVSGFDASPYSLLAVSPPRVTSLLSCASVSLTCRLGTTCGFNIACKAVPRNLAQVSATHLFAVSHTAPHLSSPLGMDWLRLPPSYSRLRGTLTRPQPGPRQCRRRWVSGRRRPRLSFPAGQGADPAGL